MRLALATLLIACALCEEDNISDLKRREPGYFLSFGKTLVAGQNETVCLTLHNAAIPAKAMLSLEVSGRAHSITKMMHSDHSCFELPVPLHTSTEVLSASLHTVFYINGSQYSSHNQEPLLIYPNTDFTFVETDRTTYNPGDKVRVRILILTQDLKPSIKEQTVNEFKIINPQGFTVAVWDHIQTELGLAQLDYQLSKETVLGKWRIKCNGVLKYFQVKRYTLPRFQVEITAPKTAYIKAPYIKITICAKYAFDKYVKGFALLKISYSHISNSSTTKMERLHNGCSQFKLITEDFNLINTIDDKITQWNMNVGATVTERGSNQIETESATINIKSLPYEIKFSDENPYFQPGLPFKGKLKVTDGIYVENEYVQICYQIAVRKTWNIKLEECSDFKFDSEGIVYFSILPLKENVVELTLMAKSLNHTKVNIEDTLVLQRWYSSSNNYIHIDRNTKTLLKCKSPMQYTVYYTTNKFRPNESVTFYYMLKTRNEILQMRKIQHIPHRQLIDFRTELTNVIGRNHKFLKLDSYIDRFILKFRLHNKILSKSQLLVYYFMGGETIASSVDIYVEKCLPNQVNAYWTNPKLYPGEFATLAINTSPNSLCAISTVDKKTSFLNSLRSLNVHNILQPFLQPRENRPSKKATCLVNQKRKIESMFLEPSDEMATRRKRSYGMTPSYKGFDAYESFNVNGISIITNMKTISKPCISEETLEMAFPLTSYDVLSEDRGVSIRSFFPETWLWELIPTGKSGHVEITRFLPHSITTWMTNIICTSLTDGVGVSSKQEIKTFQPFFVDMILPYSIKLNEILNLQVSIYNYLNYSLPISIKMGDTYGLSFIDKIKDNRISICVKPNDMYIQIFRVQGSSLGMVNVSVLAEIENSYPGVCGPETIVNKRDIVYKPLLIEPEGYPFEFSKSALLCGEDATNVTWKLDIPDDKIEGSQVAKVILNSDLMGPTIQNLEKFINVPTGCGEQVMAVLAPNLYVLRYLKMNNLLNKSLRQRAVKNIKMGYQRILDYVHKDGSFSAFGYHDDAGSMFLTSFVVRTLQQAKDFTYVDEKVIKKATDWITKYQLENGCFAAVSHVFQDMGGASMENSTAALTAYVIISLLESKIEISDGVRTNAMYCIRGQHNPDKYTLAISTYALYLLNWPTEGDRYLSRLLEIATREGNLMWWSNQAGSASANIEMTGYVLLSLLHRKSDEDLLHAGAVVRWLGTQRGSQGGFVTTQDTVVALDALSRYAAAVKGKDPELLVRISSVTQKYDITIQKSDRIKSKEVVLNTVPPSVTIISLGQGCLIAQLSVTYNLPRMISSQAFRIAVDVNPVSTIDKCSVAVITPCVSYTAIGHSNMAVLEITMPSGYEADRATLFRLTDSQDSKVKRFEEFENRVVLYFTKLNKEPICVPFNINENVIVEDQVDATVKLYDYYNPDLKVFTSYKVNKCNSDVVTLIPDLTDQISNASLIDNDFVDENEKVISKRDLHYGLNNDFVNMDVEMATPAGVEGNLPMYIKPQNNST